MQRHHGVQVSNESPQHALRCVLQIHTDWTGDCERSQVLLAPDAYLQAGLHMVLYTRSGQVPELVETPEQSCHAFISLGDAQSQPPAHKVHTCPAWPRLCTLAVGTISTAHT